MRQSEISNPKNKNTKKSILYGSINLVFSHLQKHDHEIRFEFDLVLMGWVLVEWGGSWNRIYEKSWIHGEGWGIGEEGGRGGEGEGKGDDGRSAPPPLEQIIGQFATRQSPAIENAKSNYAQNFAWVDPVSHKIVFETGLRG